MSPQTWSPWLLLLATGFVSLGVCQHWSFGLSPGGKRDLEPLSDTLTTIVEGFPHVDSSRSVLGWEEESPFAKMYRMKGFLSSVPDRENGHRPY